MTDYDLPQKCLCRLCAKYELCTNIFSTVGLRKLLALKISTCLPIQVQMNDKITKGVCPACVIKLDTAYELITTCVLVQSKLTDANTTSVCKNGQEEVTSSVLKTLPPASTPDTPGSVLVLPLTLDNVAQFNKLSSGSTASKDTASTLPMISSVLTLASGPSAPSPFDPGTNGSEDGDRRKRKERKTVCTICKGWYPRSKIQEHEQSHFIQGDNVSTTASPQPTTQTVVSSPTTVFEKIL